MNKLLPILLTFIVTSCGVSGLYYNKKWNKHTPDAFILEVCDNGTFKFYAWQDVLGECLETGTWVQNGNSIQFEPIQKHDIPETKVYSNSFDQDYSRITFYTLSSYGDTISLGTVDTLTINNKRIALDTMGSIKLGSTPIDQIEIDIYFKEFMNLQDSVFQLEKEKNNFDIYISEGYTPSLCYLMAKRKMIIKGNGLYDLDSLGQIEKDFKWKRHKRGCGHIKK